MTFEEILDQAIELLRRRGRITYRALKRQFELDDDYLEDLKDELIHGQQVGRDEDGKVLVWTGPEEDRETVAPADTVSAPDAELRHLTVMFCDMVGSTELSGRLDPEDFREVLTTYQRACDEVIGRFEGHVAQYLGDGILSYFGYPRAHEDDSTRAVRAGLEIVEAIAGRNDTLEREMGVRIAVRIGIHTGMVVIGELDTGRREQLALGETPNVAARIQGLAGPGAVVISGATHLLVQRQFEFEDLGKHELKGVAGEADAYRVLRERTVFFRGTRSTLFGREAEVELLLHRWRLGRESPGQFVMVGGEAGIGKSALVDSIHGVVEAEGAGRLDFRCSPYYSNTSLHPVTEHLRRELGITRDESDEKKHERLASLVRDFDLGPEAEPLLGSLLGLSVAEPLRLSPELQRRRTQEILVRWLTLRVAERPMLAVWEDLHWADASTLDLFEILIRQSDSARWLTVCTHRPEFQPPWAGRSNLAYVVLNRLSQKDVGELVTFVSGGRTLPSGVIDQIVARTDGVPLFVEELTKLLLESDVLEEASGRLEIKGSLPDVIVPATLHDSLMARLDRLPKAKEVAQIGATLGREFSLELIRAVAPTDESALGEALGELFDAGLLLQTGFGADTQYSFKHALIQDVAYQSLLKRTRQRYHERIVKVLEDRFPDLVQGSPELVAHHCAGAGLFERAIPYWLRAGASAVERSAHIEGVGHLTRGLDAVARLEDSPARRVQEIRLQIALGVPLTATRGYGAKEVEATYARARDLSQQEGKPAQLFRAVYGMWRLRMLRAEYARARSLASDLLVAAPDTGIASSTLAANRAMGATLFYMGEFPLSRKHTLEVIDIHERSDTALTDIYDVVDPTVTCLSYGAWSLWFLGHEREALASINRAVEMAAEIDHPFSQALALSFAAWLHQFFGDSQSTFECARASLEISEEYGFAFWVGWDNVLMAASRTMEGAGGSAASQIRTGIEHWRANGSSLGISYFLTLLAEAHLAEGREVDALKALTDAQKFADRTGERYWEAERLRITGEILSDRGLVRLALAAARSQQARALELRAARSLADHFGEDAPLRDVTAWFARGPEPLPGGAAD